MTFRAAYVLADEGYSSRGGRQDACDHVDHGALTGAIWADEGMDVTPLQPERNILRRANAAEMLRNRIYVEQRMPRVADRLKICCRTDFDFERAKGVRPLPPSNCLMRPATPSGIK